MGNFLIRMPPNVYWRCRTNFLLAQSRFWEFLLAWGHRATVSVKPCTKYLTELQTVLQ